jgi:hypothetical protein
MNRNGRVSMDDITRCVCSMFAVLLELAEAESAGT